MSLNASCGVLVQRTTAATRLLGQDPRDQHFQRLQKPATAKGIRYALGRLLDDGRIEIDNSAAERALRFAALGRNIAQYVIMRSSSRKRPQNADVSGDHRSTDCT